VAATENERFRDEVRNWISGNLPASLRGKDPAPYINDPEFAASDPDFILWRERVVARRWGAPDWPERYGGAGLSEEQARILGEELAAAGTFNPLRSVGLVMMGPTLLEFGTDEQRALHLPPIACGDVRWCQGYSEPGAGSDLASLQTKCVDAGDHWVVNGQKIWTSGADHADWCFALVRTDPSSKQGGISFLLIDMTSAGIDARPIKLISGATHFCEVFFDDVKVPKANIVGEVNKGWTIAKRLMQHERAGLAQGRGDGASLLEIARRYLPSDPNGRIVDGELRTKLIAHAMRARAYSLTMERMVADAKAGGGVTQASSILKNIGSAVSQERAELTADVMGYSGLGWQGGGFAPDEIEAVRNWLYSRAFSIYGGTYEIQNNITSKQVLALPDA
jgi:alkylation response protein AidB-like acyl-CoA dehydrogenase